MESELFLLIYMNTIFKINFVNNYFLNYIFIKQNTVDIQYIVFLALNNKDIYCFDIKNININFNILWNANGFFLLVRTKLVIISYIMS